MDMPIVFNIPHSSFNIPADGWRFYTVPEWAVACEMLILNDWFTDEIFSFEGTKKVVAQVSRVYVDTERFVDDAQEYMSQFGMGVIYTKGAFGNEIRRPLTEQERESILQKYYYPHHQALEAAIQESIDKHEHCLLIDAHSFPDKPFQYERSCSQERPDICIGLTDSNTPPEIVEFISGRLRECGYTVAIDYPYAGCLIPSRFSDDKRVSALMIEVNRKIYLEDFEVVYSKELFMNPNPLKRKSGMYRFKNIFEDIMVEVYWNFISKDKRSVTPQQHHQRRLSRMLAERVNGVLSPELSYWWHNNY